MHTPKSSKGNRGGQHPNRCCDEHRAEELITVNDPEGNREAPGGVKCSLVPLCLPEYKAGEDVLWKA